MPKKTLTPAERIAEIKAADDDARAERATLDRETLTELVVAAREAHAAVQRVEAGCADLVSDLVNAALKAQGTSMSARLDSIITVAEEDLAKVTTATEAA